MIHIAKRMLFLSKYRVLTPLSPFTQKIIPQNSYLAQPQYNSLRTEYLREHNINIFHPLLNKNSQYSLIYIQIFKIISQGEFKVDSYNFIQKAFNDIPNKSDNARIVLAKIKCKVALSQAKSTHHTALAKLDQALDVLQFCIVPPIFDYYSILLQKGFIQANNNLTHQAIQTLTEATNVLEQYVKHSEDPAKSNKYCLKQAKAFNILYTLQPQHKEWLQKANQMWSQFDNQEQKYTLKDYAETVAHNAHQMQSEDPTKAKQYISFNLYQFKGELKQLIIDRSK